MKKVSVIIPVYNVEEYLEECISCYRDKYGVYTTVDNYIIYFIPNLVVVEMM